MAKRHTPIVQLAPLDTEDTFRLLVDRIADYAIFLLDARGCVRTWNLGAQRIKGYKADEIIGQHFSSFYPAEAVAAGWPQHELQAAVERGRFEDEGWRVRKDGSRFWANVVITALRDSTGELVGFAKVTRDLTERRFAEESLRRAKSELEQRVQERTASLYAEQQRLLTTLASIGDATIATDGNGRVTLINPVAQALTGWSAEDAVGRPIEEVFHIINEETRQRCADPVKLALTEGTIVGLANHSLLIAKDGTERPIDDSAAPITTGDGPPFGVVLIFRDISERRRNEELAFRVAAIVESSADGIIGKTLDGIVTSWNQGAERLYGYAASEMIGQPIGLLIPPENRDELPAIMNRIRRGERIDHYDTVRVRRDGTRVDVSLAISPIRTGDGRLVGASVVARDISERKAAEEQLHRSNERLRLLWEAAAVLLASQDPDTMLRQLFTGIAGHLRVDAYLNHVVDDADGALHLASSTGLPPDLAPALQRVTLDEALCGSDAVAGTPVMAERIQESQDPGLDLIRRLGFSAYAALPLVADGHLLGTLAFGTRTRDRFDQEEIEFLQTIARYVTIAYVRLRLIEQLRDSDERKNRFLAMLAHELRNPLAPVRNALHVMRVPGASMADHRSAREMMERQVHHLARLVDDLLDVSRIVKDRIELRRERTDVAMIIERAVETAQPLITAGQHTLSVSLPTAPVALDVDGVRVAQAVSNLLLNAAKYTEPSGCISLTAERDDGAVTIRVTDNGIGIAPEFLPRVFDLFTQADHSLDRAQGGLGIGLTLVRKLVELHGGTVRAHSAGIGRGSEFVVRLPAVVEGDVEGPDATGLSSETTGDVRRVLIVDDNVDAAESAAILLRLCGHVVDTAHDGLSALERVETFQPHIVLLDIGLPGLDGYEVARRLRNRPTRRPLVLIAISGYGQAEDKQRARAAGFDHHLTKPIDPDLLQALVAKPDALQSTERPARLA